ncbi:MAG: class I SAM-dependent methyltransferase [Planctomycetota bacterium]
MTEGALDPSDPLALSELLGGLDIYLLDQLMKGRIRRGMRVFDAGSGGGRNVEYLMRAGIDVAATDRDPGALAALVALAERVAPALPHTNFRVDLLEDLDEPRASADVVLCIAVLHFARDTDHFRAMLDGAWGVLKPGGLFFARLASTVGVEPLLRPFGPTDEVPGRFGLPDGTERFLVDEAFLLAETRRIGGELLDPLKTSVVHGQRAMATWVMRKR